MLTTDHTRSPSAPEEEPGQLVPNREPLAVGFLGSLQGSGGLWGCGRNLAWDPSLGAGDGLATCPRFQSMSPTPCRLHLPCPLARSGEAPEVLSQGGAGLGLEAGHGVGF